MAYDSKFHYMCFTTIKEKLGEKDWLIESLQTCLAGKWGVGRESGVLRAPSKRSLV